MKSNASNRCDSTLMILCALTLCTHAVGSGGDKSQIADKFQSNNDQQHQTNAATSIHADDGYENDYINDMPGSEQRLNSNTLNKEQPTDELEMNDGPRQFIRTPTYGFGKYKKHQQPDDFHFTKELTIKQGKLKGIVRTMPHQSGLKDVDQYLGVPFAEAPIGKMRFMPPGAPPPWAGVKVADNLSPVCPQNLPYFNTTSHQFSKGRYDQLKRLLPYLKSENEDCLYLNLYIPRWNGIGPKQKYPVMIFIHGESYEWNSGNPYDGSVLASYGQVIVVTLNYRLGILGFLKRSTNDHTVSNFGLLDQIAALHWVKENIDAFEGDNKIVTLFGHGTGAACVNLLMLSPVARDLFHRAIIMSGSALSDWATANTPLHSTTQILGSVNCPTSGDNEEMLNCLWTKHYKELLKAKISVPHKFATAFGPVVDDLIVPNQPQQIMSSNTEVFSRYDLLFGLTEIESYHILNDIGLSFGIYEKERDDLLRIYMQNRFEMQPEIALSVALREYGELYGNPQRPLPDEHRDLVLDILSDARVASPLLQTGLYHSRVNPRSYMYIFSHNSKASEYAHLSHSIVGEDLPYIFGAPLASVGPFPTQFSVEERLLSEAMIVYWTNFAKTGNPKAPWRDSFLNLNPEDWEHYDIDWPEFNEINESYMNLGIPPTLSHHYRSKYMNFWNKDLPYELNRSITAKRPSYSEYLYPNNALGKPILEPSIPRSGTSINRHYDSGHLNKFQATFGRTTEDPYKTLRILLQESPNDTAMYKTQSTATPTNEVIPETPETIKEATPNSVVVRAGITVNIVIGVVIMFLLISIIVLLVYVLRGADKKKQCKMDVLTLDGGTEDNLVKRSKYNDGDDSFIMDIVKKNDYDIPRDGEYKLCRQLSTSTMDAHTKVTDWIAQEIAKSHPKDSKKSSALSIYTKSKGFLKRPTKKVSIAIDATPAARGNSVMRQEPIEITKSKSSGSDNKDIIICQEMDIDSALIDSTPLRLSDIEGKSSSISTTDELHALHIEHKHSRSDPVQMYYNMPTGGDEEITSFIDNSDINVTSRDELTERDSMSPEEALKTMQRRNFPKVLPRFSEDNLTMKRRSLPPQYFENHFKHVLGPRVPPTPPPRTTSTLGRVPSNRRASKNMLTSPLQMAENPPVEEEPTITENRLHIGPLIPKSSENLYSTFKTISKTSLDKVSYSPFETQCIQRVREEKPHTKEELEESTDQFHSEKRAQPKIIIRPGASKNAKDGKFKSNIPRVQVPMDGKAAAQLDRCTSISGSSSSETSSSTGTVRKNY